jgi:hypothetical protein
MNPEDLDRYERRCPRLGGPVSFRYCLGADEKGKACHKIIDCWWEYFDVMSFLKTHLPEKAFKALTKSRPMNKVTSLVDLIEKARERLSKE